MRTSHRYTQRKPNCKCGAKLQWDNVRKAWYCIECPFNTYPKGAESFEAERVGSALTLEERKRISRLIMNSAEEMRDFGDYQWPEVKRIAASIVTGDFKMFKENMMALDTNPRRLLWDWHHDDFFKVLSDNHLRKLKGISWVIDDYRAEEFGADTSLKESQRRTILSEKRTSMSFIRTGLAVATFGIVIANALALRKLG